MSLFRSRDENRIATLVDKLQQDGRVEQLEHELSRFKQKRLNPAERETWHHFWGIAAFQRGDRADALERFQEGHSVCPESGNIAFSLGQEYEFVGDVHKMLDAFDAAKFPKVPGAYALAQGRYAYLWGHIEKATSYVLPLLDAYYDLKIADDHFVHVRGLPFFGETWAHLGAFLELQEELGRLASITKEAASKLSDYDFDGLFDLLNCIETGDFQPRITRLTSLTAERAPHKIPDGTQRTQLAILQAHNATEPSAAMRILNAVKIEENDFPWLADMLLLGECEVADRFALPNLNDLVADFVARQSLLFEPHHVFNFRTLEYQENLKKDFQRTRVAG